MGTTFLVLGTVIGFVGLIAFVAWSMIYAILVFLISIFSDSTDVEEALATGGEVGMVLGVTGLILLGVGFVSLIAGIVITSFDKNLRITRKLGFGIVVKAQGCKVRVHRKKISITPFKSTETSTVYIKSFYELGKPLWFLRVTFYWLIGLFGIFTTKYETKYPVIDDTIAFRNNSYAPQQEPTDPDSKTPRPQMSGSSIDIQFNHRNKKSSEIIVSSKKCELGATSFTFEKLTDTRFKSPLEIDHVVRKRTKIVRVLCPIMRFASIVATVVISIVVLINL
jgi:hypothetical protein